MAEVANELRVQQPASGSPTVEAIEKDLAQTRGRLSMTLSALNGEVRMLLDPQTAGNPAPPRTRDAADLVARGLRTAGQIRGLARSARSGPVGIATVVTALVLFLSRSGLADRLWNRTER